MRAKIFDVSWWQFAERHYDEDGNEFVTLDFDNIDFEQAKKDGFDGVILRASHGWRIDESFELAEDAAKDADLLTGAYHYIYVDSGNNQWTNFWTQIEGKDLELGFFFDQERHSNDDATASDWQTVINANTKGILEMSGNDPGFYTSYWMWELTGPMYMINGKPTKEYRLWTAHWHFDFEEMPDPAIPEPWDEWEFWQQTSLYKPDWNTQYGNNTDAGVYNGTPEEFHAEYSDGEPPDPDPEPPSDDIIEIKARIEVLEGEVTELFGIIEPVKEAWAL